MTRLFVCFATAAVVAVGTAALTVPGQAQPYNPGYPGGYQGGPEYTPRSYYRQRERERERESERDRERGGLLCKGADARITSAGGSRPTVNWALSSARSVWSRQAKAAYGEEWADPGMATGEKHTCFPVTLGRRCEFSGIPCREPPLR